MLLSGFPLAVPLRDPIHGSLQASGFGVPLGA